MRQRIRSRLLLLAIIALSVTLPSRGRGSALKSDFDELVEMTKQGDWDAGDWARGSLLGIRVFRYGSPGVPYLRGRFLQAVQPNEAFLSGAFVAMHGEQVDHLRMRGELETSSAKRTWLKSMVGDGRAMTASLEQGRQWEQAVAFFPSLGGCRNFCLLCMQSKDELVRRAGLYWGFWVNDAAYWQRVQKLAGEEPDALTRKFAAHLLKARRD